MSRVNWALVIAGYVRGSGCGRRRIQFRWICFDSSADSPDHYGRDVGAMARVRRIWDSFLSIGSFPGESDDQRGKRRIIVGVSVFFIGLNVLGGFAGLGSERAWLAVTSFWLAGHIAGSLIVLRLKPAWFAGVFNVLFFLALVLTLVETVLLGGIQPSSGQILWGLMSVLGALVALGVKAGFAWFIVYIVTVVAAEVLSDAIEPRYIVEATSGDLIFNIVAVTAVVFATMAYFVRQRDRFQRQSDDLLHNILPDEIASRLKAEHTMIADHFESASVLFADVVDFTPMSAGMAPSELVGLLNEVFSTFDGFVDELGLEKIKTVGDEYMVASGVPVARPDHAHAVAELGLRIRDHVAVNDFDGHRIELRIGINSGPVVAGIIGSHKFAYDLWGDAVNTASRMESAGLAGCVQVSGATHELIRDEFVCESRGLVSVKGKGDMDTYLLISKRAEAPATN